MRHRPSLNSTEVNNKCEAGMKWIDVLCWVGHWLILIWAHSSLCSWNGEIKKQILWDTFWYCCSYLSQHSLIKWQQLPEGNDPWKDSLVRIRKKLHPFPRPCVRLSRRHSGSLHLHKEVVFVWVAEKNSPKEKKQQNPFITNPTKHAFYHHCLIYSFPFGLMFTSLPLPLILRDRLWWEKWYFLLAKRRGQKDLGLPQQATEVPGKSSAPTNVRCTTSLERWCFWSR